MRIIRAKLKDPAYRHGLFLLLVSLPIFCISEFSNLKSDESFLCFIINHLCTASYFLYLLLSGRVFKRKSRGVRGIFLVLMLTSAYSLNRQMDVFEKSTDWLSILLIVSCVNYLSFPYRVIMPKWLRHIQMFIMALSLSLFIYLSCYLFPYYAFGAVFSFLLGISLHCFVALLFVIYTLVLLKKHKTYSKTFLAGLGTVLFIIISYCSIWQSTVKGINDVAKGDEHIILPLWVTVAQIAPHHSIARQVLKSDLVYTLPATAGESFLWREPSMNFDERRKHDPLVMIAALLFGTSDIPEEDRIKVLKAMYDSRHQAQERLWSGDDLYTSHVSTAAKVWPRLHIAYTEKTVTVSNNLLPRSWNNQEEAIYTFHLPEGGVVSSLSLWINGKEEKGILTTKAKADSAYKDIVGYQQRDPSVVHWQEGNTVSVRVFPVESNKSRQFKIGITAPLSKEGDELVYRNIYFDGPSVSDTREDVSITFDTPPANLHTPWQFHMDKQTLKRDGAYKPGWEISFKDDGITANIFSANGKTFTVSPYKKQMISNDTRDVYLDINKAWTATEFEEIKKIFIAQRIWVYDNSDLIELTPVNSDALFNKLTRQHFSMFPLYRIKTPVTALLITKGIPASPAISDLYGDFVEDTKAFFATHQKIMLYNLGGELSPYMRSMKEYRVFRYEQGSISHLRSLATAHTFPADIEDAQRVVIEPADIMIRQDIGTCTSTAPDHLQRLFAYNHIMQQAGTHLLTDLPENDTLVKDAGEAYIVTPFSSLVVLETQADYDKFNIKDSEDSLKNASLHSKGAVPEPHEWALIILVLLALIYVRKRKVAI